jgi:hypothetical protein
MQSTQTLLTVLGSLALAGAANAQVVTQWNFNGASAGTVPGGPTSPTPSIGTGTASLIGGTTGSFGSGSIFGGSSDPASPTPPDFGWDAETFALQSTEDLTRGVRFSIPGTVSLPSGTTGLEVSWDQGHGARSSAWAQFRYSTDGGSSWTLPAGSLFQATSGPTWFNGRTVSLPGVLPDPSNGFIFEILATYAPSTSAYAPSDPGSTYSPAGVWRFDMVTVSAVPEPHEYALLAGLGLASFALWRRRAAK